MRLHVTDAAAADIAEAADRYEARRVGLGEAFVATVDVVLEQILEHPLRFRVAHATLRRALLPRVLAVLHGNRNPSNRLDRRT